MVLWSFPWFWFPYCCNHPWGTVVAAPVKFTTSSINQQTANMSIQAVFSYVLTIGGRYWARGQFKVTKWLHSGNELIRNKCMHVCLQVHIFFGCTFSFQYFHHFSKIVLNCLKLFKIAYNCTLFCIISHAQFEDCMFEEGIHVPLLK